MNSDDIDNQQLDAFLRGEDALSQRLRALPQAQPPAELDAAILARAANPPAANDPAPPDWKPARGRWRVPAGLAAMLLAGVLTHRTWQETNQMERVDAPAVMAGPAPAPAPAPPVAEVAAPRQKATPAEPKSAPPAKVKPAPVRRAAEPAPPPPPPFIPPVEVVVSGARAAAESSIANGANGANVKPRAQLRLREESVLAAPAPAAPVAAPAPATGPTPEAWLRLVEEMLAAGLKSDTLAEWDAFRAAHPDHPVDPELEARISALRKR